MASILHKDWDDFMDDPEVIEILDGIKVYTNKNMTCYSLTVDEQKELDEIFKESGNA